MTNNYIIKPNDIIIINFPELKKVDIKAQNINFDIVYEDENILIVDKPNNLVVHPSSTTKDSTLVNGLLKKINNLSDINGIIRPGIVHRIDKMTTGLLIIAKNNDAHKFLAKNLQAKNIKRYYMLIVHGTFKNKFGTIKAPIGRDPNNRKKMAIVNNGKSAITHFKVIKNYKNFSLLECELDTGRTHQIRVHMNYINHPIYGDNVYNKNVDNNDNFGQYLHAYKLKLIHPKTKKTLIFNSKLPKIILDKIKQLESE